MDLVSYRAAWEGKPREQIALRARIMEKKVKRIKNSYRKKRLNRSEFYPKYEKYAQQLNLLKKCLSYKK